LNRIRGAGPVYAGNRWRICSARKVGPSLDGAELPSVRLNIAMTYPHWSLFQVIDEDLHAFSRHVEFAEANYSVYSVDLLRLYLSICSEVDVIGKLLCTRIGATLRERPDMVDYRKHLKRAYPNLSGLKITIRPLALSVVPWDAWNQDANPEWWKKHQFVKHQRDQYFPDAPILRMYSIPRLACWPFSRTGISRRFIISRSALLFAFSKSKEFEQELTGWGNLI
jgi:hypothetical protein